MSPFRLGITADLAPGNEPGGWMAKPVAEILSPFPDIQCELLRESLPEIAPGLARSYDAVITCHPRWTAESLGGVRRLTLISRWGIGVDEIDLRAATESDIVVSTSPAAANHAAVAESMLALMLALSKHLLAKNRLTRQGRSADAQQLSGSLIKDRVIGIIGFGKTGSTLAEFLRPLRPARVLAHDPYVSADAAAGLGVTFTDLETVMRDSDYVAVMCSLTDETRHLIDANRLSLMKPTAFLLNAARGAIVDQEALTRALQESRIAGAALDVLDPEPPEPSDPILTLDNVITTGHALAWTRESLYETSLEACRAVARVYEGLEPTYVANPDVLLRAGFRAKLERRRAVLGNSHA